MRIHRTILCCLVLAAGSTLGVAQATAQTMTPVTPASICDGVIGVKQIATIAQRVFPGSRVIKVELEVEHAAAGGRDDGSGHDANDDRGGSDDRGSGHGSGSGGGVDDGPNHDAGDDDGNDDGGDDNGGPEIQTCQYEVKLLQANQIIEARFDAVTGALVSSEVDTDRSRVNTLKNQAKNAKIGFAKAVDLAQRQAGDDRPVKVELRQETGGRTFRVEFMDDGTGQHTAVHVHSKNQKITRIDR